MSAPVFLLSDFGHDDIYVGVMKAVIARNAPASPMVDLLHQLPPQNVGAARLQLAAALPWLPDGAVVLAVVDPGVGSDRVGLAIRARDDTGRTIWMVAPDNGLATSLLTPERPPYDTTLRADAAWVLAEPPPASAGPGTTFDGRDLFAPAAGRLARGEAPDRFARATPLTDPVRTPAPALDSTPAGIRGQIAWVDRFGDLVSDVPAPARYLVRLGNTRLEGPAPSFASVPRGALLSYVGSLGTVEIAVRDGSAATTLGTRLGDEVTVAPLDL